MYHRILVPTDGSPLSKKAVASAIEQAAATGADLVALYVVPRYPMSYFEGSISVSNWTSVARVIRTASIIGPRIRPVFSLAICENKEFVNR